MLTDIVIPFRNSEFTYNAELRYCLRGIEKHFKNVRTVHLIGDKPDYVLNVNHIPHLETNWYQQLTKNICDKLLAACYDSNVSDPFVYFNDDHFILTNMSVYTLPFYHKGQEWNGSGKYLTTLANTRQRYPDANNFDTHAPMVIYKEAFRQAMGALPWQHTDFGFAVKTSYCAYHGITGEYYPDLKIDKKINSLEDLNEFGILYRNFFSVGDRAMTPFFISMLETIYPTKSKYEI